MKCDMFAHLKFTHKDIQNPIHQAENSFKDQFAKTRRLHLISQAEFEINKI